MSALAQRRMTVDEFLDWAEGQEGRWELLNGVPYRMPQERMGHIEAKVAAYLALRQAVQRAGVPCHAVADGGSVRISQHMLHVPDALVYCGPKLPKSAIEVPNPVILVEVASPSTRKLDETVKLDGYFTLPSVHHYLMVDPDGPPLVHHRRETDGTVSRSVVHAGTLALAPPGIELTVAELFAPAS